jgi:hypothetical protein
MWAPTVPLCRGYCGFGGTAALDTTQAGRQSSAWESSRTVRHTAWHRAAGNVMASVGLRFLRFLH